jgi:GTP-binding protein LepA
VHYPDPSRIAKVREPYIKGSVMMPERYIGAGDGAVPRAARREHRPSTTSRGRVELTSELPLAEVLFDFYDRLKTVTQGYGSFDYELLDYRETDLVKVDILVNGEKVDALSQLVHRDKARARALHYCERLAETIPRSSSRSRSRAPSAARSSPAPPSPPSARTSPPSATAATSPASASCSRSRRRARSG